MGDQEVSKTLENKRDEGKKSPSQPPNEVGGPKEEGEQNELESDEIFQQLLSGFEKIGPSHLYTRVSDDFTPIDIHDQPVEKVQEKQSLIEESVIIEDKVSASLIEENLNFKFGESSKKFEQPVPVQVESHHEVPSKNLKIVFPIIGNPNEQKAPQFNRPASRRFVTEDISYKKCINNIFSNILYKKLLDECCQRNNIFIDKVTSLLFTILRKYPLQIKQLREILEQELAHHLQGKVVVITQLHNMLMIANRIPELESSILESVLDKIMKIDSEGYSESLKEKADDLIQLFLLYLTNRLTPVQALQVESSEPQVKASDFDICFDKGISHLESSVFGDSTSNQNEPNELFQHDQRARTGYSLLGIVRQNSTFFQNFEEKLSATLHLVTHSSNEKLVELLLTFFSRKVIKVEKPMYIQFVFFYLCTFEQELSWIKEAFLETLILNIMDPRLQRQVKLNSLYYLFSFLACANFSTPLITFTALQYLLKACRLKYKSYIRKNRYLTEFLNQSGYKIDAQISGKDYSQIIEDSANQLNSMLRKRRTETEDIKSMGDDIFIYCLQSFLYILCDHFYRMNKQQKRQIMDDFDNFMSDKELFLRFSNAESDVFEDLYNKLVITVNFKESKARQKIKRILEEEEQQSLLNSKDGFPQFKIKSGLAKGIDYFPFEPVEANFFHKFIEQHVDCGSTPSSFFSEHHENEIVNDQDKQKKWERGSNLSVMDTSTGTCNQFKGDISPFVQQKNKRRTMTPPSRKMLKLQFISVASFGDL